MKNEKCVNEILDVLTRKLAKEKYLYKQAGMTAKKLKEILVYEPPAKKMLVFKGHKNGDSQYIPEFLPRLLNYAYNNEIKTTDFKFEPDFLLKLLNCVMTYKGKDVVLRKYKAFNKPATITDNSTVRFIITFAKCKIVFPDLDAYRKMEPNSLYIVSKKVPNLEIIGTDFLVFSV